jgi:hypothetical protein
MQATKTEPERPSPEPLPTLVLVEIARGGIKASFSTRDAAWPDDSYGFVKSSFTTFFHSLDMNPWNRID